jgi:hypothetical protein
MAIGVAGTMDFARTRAAAGDFRSQPRRRRVYDPDALALQREQMQTQRDLAAAQLGLQRDSLASQERVATAGQQTASRDRTLAAKVAFGTSEYGDDAEMAKQIFGGEGGGVAPARPAKKLYDTSVLDASQQTQKAANIGLLRQQQERLRTHPGEAAARGTMAVQAAPGTPEMTSTGQDAGTLGAAAGQVRDEYQKSPVFIRGLAELKAANNARQAANVKAETAYQQSTGSIPAGKPMSMEPGTGTEGYATQNLQGQPINQPNMPGPAPMTPADPAALADKQTPAGVDFYGERDVQKVIERNMDLIRRLPTGSPQSKAAQAVVSALQKARMAQADQTGQGGEEAPASPQQASGEGEKGQAGPTGQEGNPSAAMVAQKAAGYAQGQGAPAPTEQPAPAAPAAAGEPAPQGPAGQPSTDFDRAMADMDKEIEYWQGRYTSAGTGLSPAGVAAQGAAGAPGGGAQTSWRERARKIKETAAAAGVKLTEAEIAAKVQATATSKTEAEYQQGARPEAGKVKSAAESALDFQAKTAAVKLREADAAVKVAEEAAKAAPKDTRNRQALAEATLARENAVTEMNKATARKIDTEVQLAGGAVTPAVQARVDALAGSITLGSPSMAMFENLDEYEKRIGRQIQTTTEMLDGAGSPAARAATAGAVLKNAAEWTEWMSNEHPMSTPGGTKQNRIRGEQIAAKQAAFIAKLRIEAAKMPTAPAAPATQPAK